MSDLAAGARWRLACACASLLTACEPPALVVGEYETGSDDGAPIHPIGEDGAGDTVDTTDSSADDAADGSTAGEASGEVGGDGDGDGDGESTGDGDGNATGDGDGESTGDGDGDGESTGDGDGDGESTGDGDGDGDGDQCAAPTDYVDCDGQPGALTFDPFQAIGLNCPGGDATNSIQVQNATLQATNANAWRVATTFGSSAGSRFGGRLWAASDAPWLSPNAEVINANTSTAVLVLSTGEVASPDVQGVVLESPSSQEGNGDNGNEDAGGLPTPLSALRGSAMGAGGSPFNDCDGLNDCSDSLYEHWFTNGWNDPNDKLWMSFDLTVPPGTRGYVFDFAYFSSEWPSYIGTQYNDLFIAWQVSEAYTGNVTFVNDAPLTITSLDDAGAFAYTEEAPQLAETGFEGNAATGWFVARGAVTPGEVAALTFFLADMGDSILATNVIIDNFRWECEGCVISEIDDCGLLPVPE